jgi:hypothetical protein
VLTTKVLLIAKVFGRKWSQFAALPVREKLWCFHTLWLLALCRLLVLFTPASFFTRALGRDAGVAPFSVIVDRERCQQARRIGSVITAIASITPWRSMCLEQALCAQCFLRWYHISAVTFLGVTRDAEATLKSHAWVCSGAQTVTGGSSFSRFTVVRTFVSPWVVRAGSFTRQWQ